MRNILQDILSCIQTEATFRKIFAFPYEALLQIPILQMKINKLLYGTKNSASHISHFYHQSEYEK